MTRLTVAYTNAMRMKLIIVRYMSASQLFTELQVPSYQAVCRNLLYKYYQTGQFSVPQIEYALGGSSKKGSHAYFLLNVAMVLLL